MSGPTVGQDRWAPPFDILARPLQGLPSMEPREPQQAQTDRFSDGGVRKSNHRRCPWCGSRVVEMGLDKSHVARSCVGCSWWEVSKVYEVLVRRGQ